MIDDDDDDDDDHEIVILVILTKIHHIVKSWSVFTAYQVILFVIFLFIFLSPYNSRSIQNLYGPTVKSMECCRSMQCVVPVLASLSLRMSVCPSRNLPLRSWNQIKSTQLD